MEGEGRKDPLPESLPPKNRACDFHRTRLTHDKSFYIEAGFTTFKPRLWSFWWHVG